MRLLLALLLACHADPEAEYRRVLNIPAGMAVPATIAGNPPTEAKLELGRKLFHDNRLSANQTMSCATCHLQALAFTDGKKTPEGSTGHVLARNSQGLINAAYNASFTWSNDTLLTLEAQLRVPITNDRPIELGVNDANNDEMMARFASDPAYKRMFVDAFGDSEVNVERIIFALATFVRSLVSANSPYDRFVAGDEAALTEQQKRGMALFNGERLECFHCHTGANFTVSYRDSKSGDDVRLSFFNNGLYNVGDDSSYPASDQGLFDLTSRVTDKGRFRPPSLRNVALTAPYMHDGSLATLEDVLRHYASGGQPNKYKSSLVRQFAISEEEIADVIAFLRSLTDESVLTNPAFAGPE